MSPAIPLRVEDFLRFEQRKHRRQLLKKIDEIWGTEQGAGPPQDSLFYAYLGKRSQTQVCTSLKIHDCIGKALHGWHRTWLTMQRTNRRQYENINTYETTCGTMCNRASRRCLSHAITFMRQFFYFISAALHVAFHIAVKYALSRRGNGTCSKKWREYDDLVARGGPTYPLK